MLRNIKQETVGSRTTTEVIELGPRTVQFPLTGGAVFTMSVNKPIDAADFKRIQDLVDLSQETFCDKGRIGFQPPEITDTL